MFCTNCGKPLNVTNEPVVTCENCNHTVQVRQQDTHQQQIPQQEVQQPNTQHQQAPQYQNTQYQQHTQQHNQQHYNTYEHQNKKTDFKNLLNSPSESTFDNPISVKHWIFNLLLVSIFPINIIMLIIWAIGSGNISESKKNYARANLILMVASIVLIVLFYIAFFFLIFLLASTFGV